MKVLIMAGGRGSRLWPVSRPETPKQFAPLFLHERSLFQATVDRARKVTSEAGDILVVVPAALKSLAEDQAPDLPGENFICEPEGRDTAACLVFAHLGLKARFEDDMVLVLPSDHWVGDLPKWTEAVAEGLSVARGEECLLTFGIRPTRPETEFGYIEPENDAGFSRVRLFHEKPDLRQASTMVETGGFLWNTGMFAWSISMFLREAVTLMPEIVSPLEQALAGNLDLAEVYAGLPRTSIDRALLEKSHRVGVLPVAYPWDDLGNWNALSRVSDTSDPNGNVHIGAVFSMDTRDSVVVQRCSSRKVVTLGVTDCLVVDTEDTVFVAARSHLPLMKELLDHISQDEALGGPGSPAGSSPEGVLPDP